MNGLHLILIGILIFSFISVIYIVFAILKNENTYRNHQKIIDAIYDYQIDMLNKGCYFFIRVNYADAESYYDTYKRWWDWGYTRILPPEKFEVIKPYIK